MRESEVAYYKTKLNKYGLPLDSRRDYTKLDWSVWTATLAANPADFNAIMDPIALWINEGPSRVPLTDWYDTKTGKQEGFQARSVVGGVFIKALSDHQLTEKWRARNTEKVRRSSFDRLCSSQKQNASFKRRRRFCSWLSGRLRLRERRS